MKIVLSGVETNNKGAELMLYAILQEIERKWPDAEMYISRLHVLQGLDYVETPLIMHNFPFESLIGRFHINGILRRLKLPMIYAMNFIKGDYFLDGSGFLFSDQCDLWGSSPQWWEDVLRVQHNYGAKIIFLPQAFGPIKKTRVQQAIAALDKYADLIMPREQVSFNYLKESGLVNMKKVRKYTDFTSLVEGQFPDQYKHLRNGICIIPNLSMISSGSITYEKYISFITALAIEGSKSGHPVYLLNHEGIKDAELCQQCKESIQKDIDIDVVTNLDAIKVKGLIASAYMVITSRFHGLASALNSCVPCLATSWSHKYEELFKDYDLDNLVLPLDDIDDAVQYVKKLLDSTENQQIRNHLCQRVPNIKEQTRKMWEEIWSL